MSTTLKGLSSVIAEIGVTGVTFDVSPRSIPEVTWPDNESPFPVVDSSGIGMPASLAVEVVSRERAAQGQAFSDEIAPKVLSPNLSLI
jgi:hypothetical protein